MNEKVAYYISLSCILICVIIVFAYNIILFNYAPVQIEEMFYKDIFIKQADDIYFNQNIADLLNTMYMLMDTEAGFCLDGFINDTGVYVNSLSNSRMVKTSKSDIYGYPNSCKKEIGYIHSHPSGEFYGHLSCLHSNLDIETAKEQNATRIIDCVICGLNKISCLTGDIFNTNTINYVQYY